MLGILILLFTTIPVLELYLLIQVGGVIGTAPTVGIVLLTGFVGAFLARQQGRSVFSELQKTLSEGREPTNILIQGVLVFMGGLLLLTPGFATDFLGMSFIFPLTRKLIVASLKKHFKKGIQSGSYQFYSSTTTHRSPEDSQQSVNPNVIDVESERIE